MTKAFLIFISAVFALELSAQGIDANVPKDSITGIFLAQKDTSINFLYSDHFSQLQSEAANTIVKVLSIKCGNEKLRLLSFKNENLVVGETRTFYFERLKGAFWIYDLK